MLAASKVFFPHDDLVWVTGELIAESEEGEWTVRYLDVDLPKDTNTRQFSLKKYGWNNLPLQNVDMPELGVEDMTSLSYLHEPSILDNLRRLSLQF